MLLLQRLWPLDPPPPMKRKKNEKNMYIRDTYNYYIPTTTHRTERK